ncbi:MAG: type II toxin-antitoxin system PemK/MazF family toxin [Syntrophomonadaceae bacterium]|jgi:mRNA interferase MazF|nr:type II toxin-antitoxin system PemK/MazF family toxin [Syntrophomonadaceae bacterium]
MVINQGDIYWYTFPTPEGSQPMGRRPVVVVQNNICNQSRVNTVIICPLTTNLRLAIAPGNILLETGEANIPKQSVINVSQVQSIDKSSLGEYIGSLSMARIYELIKGLQMWLIPKEPVKE